MSEEKFTAKRDQLIGSVKEGFGKLVDNKSIETEGQIDQLVGKLKEGVTEAKETVEGVVSGVTKHLKDLTDKKESDTPDHQA